MSEPLVVIGNGMAAARLVEELDAYARGRYAVAVIGAELHLAYNRVLLSSLLAGEVEQNEIELRNAEWWRTRGVTLLYGRGAEAIDLVNKKVRLRGGAEIPFSKLVLATGSQPVRLPVPGAELEGVLTFRDLADVAKIAGEASTDSRVIVIGGGLLGLEAAYGLAKRGTKVTLLHLMPHLMERQLDANAALILRKGVEALGIDVICGAETATIEGPGRVESVRLKDGRTYEAGAVVMALGVRPNIALAQNAGIAVGRGIVVDDGLATNMPGIYAIGECAEHRGLCYGLVEPAYEQARVLARNLAGKAAQYEGSTLSTNLKVSGVNVFSAGEFAGDRDSEEIVLSDPLAGNYKRLVLRGNRLIGAVLTGDTTDGLWYLDLIRKAEPVHAIRDSLAFGRDYSLQEAA